MKNKKEFSELNKNQELEDILAEEFKNLKNPGSVKIKKADDPADDKEYNYRKFEERKSLEKNKIKKQKIVEREIQKNLSFDEEKQEVKKLRDSRMRISDIAKHFGKSLFWVESRLKDDRYKSVSPEDFISETVLPYLIKNGHDIIGKPSKRILSKKDNVLFISKVRINLTLKDLQIIIGELVHTKSAYKGIKDQFKTVHLQIVLPKNQKTNKLLYGDYINNLEELTQIEFIFI